MLSHLRHRFNNDTINHLFQQEEYLATPSLFSASMKCQQEDFLNLIVDALHVHVPVGELDLAAGHPVLARVPLTEDLTADLLVRSDCLHYLFAASPLSRPERRRGSRYSCGWHYQVVMVKFRTLAVTPDGKRLANTDNNRLVQHEAWMYNDALAQHQDMTPDFVHVIGRRYTSAQRTWTRYNETAVTMIRDTSPVPLSPNETEPFTVNMKRVSQYQNAKKVYATNNGNVTLVWQCTPKHKERLDEQGILTMYDSRCTAAAMGMKGKTALLVDAILNQQRASCALTVPTPIPKPHPKAFYVDFETITPSLMDTVQTAQRTGDEFLFMIGVGWAEDGVWMYRPFIADNLTRAAEATIMRDFLAFLPADAALYHWHNAEPTMWKRACNRHTKVVSPSLAWTDLKELFKKHHITVKGCFTFRLKDVVRALYAHQLVGVDWHTDVHNGLECAAMALSKYLAGDSQLGSIVDYNEMDCRALYEILSVVFNVSK